MPTGPRAWRRPVATPSSAPRPKRKPSEKRVDALWNTQAESTLRRKAAATSGDSVMTASVWFEEWALIKRTASSRSSTSSRSMVASPYSKARESAGGVSESSSSSSSSSKLCAKSINLSRSSVSSVVWRPAVGGRDVRKERVRATCAKLARAGAAREGRQTDRQTDEEQQGRSIVKLWWVRAWAREKDKRLTRSVPQKGGSGLSCRCEKESTGPERVCVGLVGRRGLGEEGGGEGVGEDESGLGVGEVRDGIEAPGHGIGLEGGVGESREVAEGDGRLARSRRRPSADGTGRRDGPERGLVDQSVGRARSLRGRLLFFCFLAARAARRLDAGVGADDRAVGAVLEEETPRARAAREALGAALRLVAVLRRFPVLRRRRVLVFLLFLRRRRLGRPQEHDGGLGLLLVGDDSESLGRRGLGHVHHRPRLRVVQELRRLVRLAPPRVLVD
mmetsp:Transcript_10048/g.32275  ORF Transcript_10048/g.32275 Transcript_10048/m.32275 type:complete len:447 (+) Transcript_10048:217-1557(+)